MNNKIILVDWNIFVFRSIFSWRLNKQIPPTYTALSMLISVLKKVGCHPDDTIILAVDSKKGSWRRNYDVQYKANRKAKREKYKDIDWKKFFNQFNYLLSVIPTATPFFVVDIDYYEADDIIATACKYYADKTCIIISSDSDYEQLLEFKNVKLFSPVSKKYKHVANPFNTLLKKIKQEKTDNLITPIDNEKDYMIRVKLVDLVHLPPDVENEVNNRLDELEFTSYDITKLPFKTLQERFMGIYNSDEIVSEFPRKKKKKKKTKTLEF